MLKIIGFFFRMSPNTIGSLSDVVRYHESKWVQTISEPRFSPETTQMYFMGVLDLQKCRIRKFLEHFQGPEFLEIPIVVHRKMSA